MTVLEWGDKLFTSDREITCPKCGFHDRFYIADYGRNWNSETEKKGWGYNLWCNNCIQDDIWIWEDEIELSEFEVKGEKNEA